jgi:hypothetical protein
MPGSDACGRCGTSLRLATAVMDVQPPRAGKFTKKWRRAVPVRKLYYNLRDGVENAPVPKLRRPRFEFETDLPPWNVVWRMVVPGWPHFRAGHPVRGRLYLWSTLALLFMGLIGLGTSWGSVFLGLAFSVHTSAALDIYNLCCPGRQFRRLMIRSIAVTAYIAVLVYLPAAWLFSRVAAARSVDMIGAPFQAGDVLLVNHSLHGASFPRAGQVVMYEIPMTQLYNTTTPERHEIGYLGGEAVDRVLAVGGDNVIWDGAGGLTVNGTPSPLLPLNPSRIKTRIALRVPDDSVFILPSTIAYAPLADVPVPPPLMQILKSNVTGTVYLRTHPLWRMKVIR